MRRLALFFYLVSVVCWAGEEPAWLGFKEPSDHAVPTAISRAATSVFQIIYPGGSVEIMEVGHIELKNFPRSRPEWFRVFQIGVCQHQKIKRCPIFSKPITGSAFLVKDTYTVATNLHMIQPWLYYAMSENPGLELKDIQAPILLADREFRVFFNAMDMTTNLKLSNFNSSAFTFAEAYPGSTPDKQLFFSASDYVELRANTPFAVQPLQFGKIDDHREPLFTIGFPKATEIFAMRGGFDSPGIESWVSTGRLKPQIDPEGVAFLTNISSSAGSDGGPLLNYSGQVVGILFSGVSRVIDNRLVTDSQFLNVDQKVLQKIWSRFTTDGNHL